MASAPLPRNSRIEERWNCVNQTLQGQNSTENACCQRLAGQRQAASVSGRSGSGVAGTGTPLMGDHLEEFFCVEQFTGWEGKFRLNLPGNLVRHIESHVGRQRIPPVQERLDERKLLWRKPLRSEGGCGRHLPGLGWWPNRLGVQQRLF